LTPEEEAKVLEILERYLPELENKTVRTDSKELRKFFKERQAFMQELMRRLKSLPPFSEGINAVDKLLRSTEGKGISKTVILCNDRTK
jgi:hypothetical protein